MSKETVCDIICETGYGDVATCVKGQPRVRPMAFVLTDEGKLWSSTYRQSGKVQEFLDNPHVEICFMNTKRIHVRIEGIVHISEDAEKKRLLLQMNPKVKRHFSDEHDEKFMLIEVTPTRVRWTPPGFSEYQEVEWC